MLKLESEVFNQIVKLLVPFVSTGVDRSALIVQLSVIDPNVHSHIRDTSGNSGWIAATTIVSDLIQYGELSTGAQALWEFLKIIRDQTGMETQGIIDALEKTVNISSKSSSLLPIKITIAHTAPDTDFAARLTDLISNAKPLSSPRNIEVVSYSVKAGSRVDEILKSTDIILVVLNTNSAADPTLGLMWTHAVLECKPSPIIVFNEKHFDSVPSELTLYPTFDLSTPESIDHNTPELISYITRPSSPLAPAPSTIRIPPEYIYRVDEYRQILSLLLNPSDASSKLLFHSKTLAIQGMGGVGKSLLALSVAHSCLIRRAFSHVFWFKLEQNSSNGSRTEYMRRIGMALGDDRKYESLAAAADCLCELLQDKEYLIILDNVWDAQYAEDFQAVLGLRCRLLITTRSVGIADKLHAQTVQLGMLSQKQSTQLLEQLAGRKDAYMNKIAQRLGFHPLALNLAGARLREMSSENWISTFESVSQLKIDYDSNKTDDNLIVCFDASVNLLAENNRLLFHTLGVFPEGKEIPESVIVRFWRRLRPDLSAIDCSELIRHLSRLALIERRSSKGGVSIHDLLHGYNRLRLGESYQARQIDLVRSFNPTGNPWHAVQETEPYFYRQLVYHMREAGLFSELLDLLFNIKWLEIKLEKTSPSDLIDDYELALSSAASSLLVNKKEELLLLRNTIQLSAFVLAMDAKQVLEQLYGRLIETGASLIQALLEQNNKDMWLKPLKGYLMPPDTVLLRTIQAHTAMVTAVNVHPNGETAISAAHDNNIILWDIVRGIRRFTLTGHNFGISCAAWSSNNQFILTGSYDRTIKLWDAEKGLLRDTFNLHSGGVTALTLDENDMLCASGDQYGTVKIWSVRNGEILNTLQMHDASITALALLSKKGLIAASARNGAVKLWDIATGTEVNSYARSGVSNLSLVVSFDESQIVIGSSDKTVKLWDISTGEVTELTSHGGWVRGLAISSDGQMIASGSDDNTIKLWSTKDTERLKRTLTGHGDKVSALSMSATGKLIVSGDAEGRLKVWDLTRDKPFPKYFDYERANSIQSIAVSRNQAVAVVGTDNRRLRVWDLVSQEETKTIKDDKGSVRSVAITADGKLCLASSHTHQAKLWNLESNEVQATLIGHTADVRSVALTPDGQIGVTGSTDFTVKVWDLNTQKERVTFVGHTHNVNSVAISDDGRYVFSASKDATIRIWDVMSGQEKAVLDQYQGDVRKVIYSGQHEIIVSGSMDRSVKVWSLDGRLLADLRGHRDTVWSVDIDPSGKYIVSASADGVVAVWDWQAKRLAADFYLETILHSCSFISESMLVVGGSGSNALCFFSLEQRKLRNLPLST